MRGSERWVEGLADVAGADEGGGGAEAEVVAAAADGEAVDVDLEAAPGELLEMGEKLKIEGIPDVGTLDEGDYESGGKGPYLLSTVDPYVNANITEIAEGKATCFVSGYNALLSGIDFSRIKYLAAVIDHIVAGYYKVEFRDVFNAAKILEEEKRPAVNTIRDTTSPIA